MWCELWDAELLEGVLATEAVAPQGTNVGYVDSPCLPYTVKPLDLLRYLIMEMMQNVI